MRSCVVALLLSASFPLAAHAGLRAPEEDASSARPGDDELPTRVELAAEVGEKVGRLRSLMAAKRLKGVLLRRVSNVAWLSAGMADRPTALTRELAAFSLLVLADGTRYLLAPNNELPRLMSEDLRGLGFVPYEYKWYEEQGAADSRPKILRELTRGGRIGTDAPFAAFPVIQEDLLLAQAPLTDSELKKYRWLGRNASEAVAQTVRALQPGLGERQIEAMVSDALLRRDLQPVALRVATDDRIHLFRGPPSSAGARLRTYGMVGVCARRWGLSVALSRFVHFGPLPKELKARLEAVARVNAELQARTVTGTRAADLLKGVKAWYAANGFPGEWERYPQGGAIGYSPERDWILSPGSPELVQDRQAFAWNPTIQGAAIEDTILSFNDTVENITILPDWPSLTVEVDGRRYPAPAILVKEPPAAATPRPPGAS